jgi:hypothetical protein
MENIRPDLATAREAGSSSVLSSHAKENADGSRRTYSGTDSEGAGGVAKLR